jgi:hydrogenase/urease accessory protein HupE
MRLDRTARARWRHSNVVLSGFRKTLERSAPTLVAGIQNVLRVFITGVMLCVFTPLIHAHDPGISTAEARLQGGVLKMTTGFAPDDAKHFLPPGLSADERWDDVVFEGVQKPLEQVVRQLWEIRVNGELIESRDGRVQLLPGDNVSFTEEFFFERPAERMTLKALKIGGLPDGHRQFVLVFDESGSVISKKLLSARDFTLELAGMSEAPATSGNSGSPHASSSDSEEGTFWGFFQLGVEHIWTGYDHLLFLFALLVVCRSFRSIVTIVTCFTVAHSITLALATLDIVNLPARLVEPVIAASIVYVGVENLLLKGKEPTGRTLLTFLFGLIHGFGFAGILRDLGVGRDGSGEIALPLFSFNLGVEIGQIVIAAIVLPFIWKLRERPTFVSRGVPALSGIVAAAGLFWLLERTLF